MDLWHWRPHLGRRTNPAERARCPECGVLRAVQQTDRGAEHGVCLTCGARLRRSMFDGRWKIESYDRPDRPRRP